MGKIIEVSDIHDVDNYIEKVKIKGSVKTIIESKGEFYLVEDNRGIIGINIIPYTISRDKLEKMVVKDEINKAYIYLVREILLNKGDTLNRTKR